MVSATPPRWGENVDDSDDEEMRGSSSNANEQDVVPPTIESWFVSQGIQTTTTYKRHSKHSRQLIKTITKSNMDTVTAKDAERMQERGQWREFGQAAIDTKEKNQNTVRSKEETLLEDPRANTDLQDQDADAAIAENLNAFWAKQKRRQLERKYDVGGTPGAEGGGSNEGWTQVENSLASGGGSTPGAAGSAGPGEYMTPTQRVELVNPDTGGFRQTDDLNTLRVTNLSTSTTESDIQDLFARYGPILRVYLIKDKETMESRGFAFVSFVNKEDAERAMEGLQGHGYDHLILKIEFAKPNTNDPSAAIEFRSGYDEVLAQDITAKVSYASNLTR
ncbi:hypothetical protein MPSEU_000123900 [Mayamaea pseudoterrestris]|nr:hypothetical protein MPSEU_000123900 [Mayamaea pseudoterrestris]